MSISIGVDPGKTGAVAIVKFDRSIPLDLLCFDLDKFDDPSIYRELSKWVNRVKFVTMEKVGYTPGNGGRASFSFGREVGRIEALTRATGLKIKYVHPLIWSVYLKDKAKLSRKFEDNKERNVEIFKKLYPQDMLGAAIRPRLRKYDGYHSGCVDASLIALHSHLEADRIDRYNDDLSKRSKAKPKAPKPMFL